MRRPLCLTGLAFVVVLLLGIYMMPEGAQTYDGLDREHLMLIGVVEWKEHKISKGEEVLVVSLGQVVVLNPILINSLENLPETIRETTAKQMMKYCEKNKARLCLPDAGGIEGVLCYPAKEPAMGSVVLMEGKFYAFSHATNPGEFDGADYYRIMQQQGRLMQADCLAQSRDYSIFRERLYACREYLSRLLHACYPEEEASVMGAMLLGEKGTLDTNIKSLYQSNGIIHILAISGLHLSILGMGVYKLLNRLRAPKMVNIILSIALMYCYGMMTGMGVSIVRALVMFGLKLAAPLVGRTYDMLTAMTVAALLILVQQPLYLTHSGFLFSFGAICGIGFLPEISGHLPSSNKCLKALSAGAWVSLATLPVHLCFYYEFPPFSVLLNLVVIPCMGVLLLSGVCVMAAAVFFLPLGRFAALPGIWILAFYERCCEFCMKLPGRRWITGRPEGWRTAAFLGILLFTVFLAKKMKRRHFTAALILAAAVLTLRLPGGLTITVLDVGQGDGICLEVGGRHFLIDGGSSDTKDVDVFRIVPFLKYRGISRLDAVFVTHPDSDHENGIRGMLENYEENGIKIGMLVMPDVAAESKNENYRTLVALAEEEGVPVRLIHAGERMESGRLSLTCLHPAAGYENEDTNAYSTVLCLKYGKFSALFTGDLEGEGEALVTELLCSEQVKTDVEAEKKINGQTDEGDEAANGLTGNITLLKVAHHGSKNSTSEAFLSAVSPGIAVISAGRDNSYGHPHRETLERLEGQGCRIFQTPEAGAVTIRVKGERVRVEKYIK